MVVGLTGGIGSGKTTVLNLFKALGIPIYIADIEAKRLMNNDEYLKKEIKEILGEEAYLNNQLNKKYIAAKVFSNDLLLNQLNSLVHPVVYKDFDKFVLSNKEHDYIVYESAILLENNGQQLCDRIIVVVANTKTRINRVMERDNTSKEEVMLRIKNQISEEEQINKANYVIHNNLDVLSLSKKVEDIHQELTLLKEL